MRPRPSLTLRSGVVLAAVLLAILLVGQSNAASRGGGGASIPGQTAQPSSTTEVTVDYVGGGLWGYPQAVAVAGNYAYVGMGHGIEIMDVSDPAAPLVVSRIHTLESDIRAVAVTGNHLLAAELAVLRVYDVSDPRDPVEEGSCAIGAYHDSQVSDLAVLGDAVYIGSYGNGLGVVSIADPQAPVLELTLPPERPHSIEVSGNLLLVSALDGLRTYSLASPHHPFLLGQYAFHADASNDVTALSSYAYLAQPPRSLQVIDLSLPAVPAKVLDFDAGGPAVRCDIEGNLLFMAMGYEGLNVADLSNPVAPLQVGSLATGGYASKVTASGSTAYVVNSDVGLQIVDVALPSQPNLIATIPRAGGSGDVTVVGDYAFVSNSGLKVISIENPVVPITVGELSLHYWSAHALTVRGEFVYAGDYDVVPGIRAISVADPTAPTPLGFCNLYAEPTSLVAELQLLYVTDGNLRIVDLSVPHTPQLVAGLFTPGEAQDVCLSGTYAYVADGESGLLIVDVFDPYQPFVVGSFDSPGMATGVCVAGTRAYLADGAAGLSILDVSDPHAPTLLGSHDTPGIARRVKIYGDYAVVADQNRGIQIINVSIPASTHLYTAATYDTRSTVLNLVVDGDHLIVAGGGEMLVLSLAVYSGAYLSGDVNADSTITSADVIYLVNFVFKGGPQPLLNYRSGDVDCNGSINSADLIVLVNYVFKGGEAPGCG